MRDTTPQQNMFANSMEWLANLLAFLAAFFAGPEVYFRTLPLVIKFAETRYGEGFGGAVQVVWFLLTFGLVYFASRAVLAIALIALFGSAALRFLAL